MAGADMTVMERWAHLTLAASLEAIGAEAGGIALRGNRGAFRLLAFYGFGRSGKGEGFRLPLPFQDLLATDLVRLTFPETALLPCGMPLRHALVAALGDGVPFGFFWVGRFRPVAFTEAEQMTLQHFAQGFSHHLIPFLPSLSTKRGFLTEVWLGHAMRVEVPAWLEASLRFLLEVLLYLGRTQDGLLVLSDREGETRFGIAQGKGHRFLTQTLPPFPREGGWVWKSVMEPKWSGFLAVRSFGGRRGLVEEAVGVGLKVLPILVAWATDAVRISSLMDKDPSTQLLTPPSFLSKLEGELHRAERLCHPLAVMVIQIEGLGFKEHLFRCLAQVVQKLVRRYDLICRYGTDKISFALPATDDRGALSVAKRIREGVFERGLVREGIAIGIAVTMKGGVRAIDLMGAADRAVGEAGSEGGVKVLLVGEEPIPSLPPLPPLLWSVLAQYLGHSLNNPTAGILGLAQLAMQEPSLSPPVQEALEQIEKLAFRLREFSRHLTRSPAEAVMRELEEFQRRLRGDSPSRPQKEGR